MGTRAGVAGPDGMAPLPVATAAAARGSMLVATVPRARPHTRMRLHAVRTCQWISDRFTSSFSLSLLLCCSDSLRNDRSAAAPLRSAGRIGRRFGPPRAHGQCHTRAAGRRLEIRQRKGYSPVRLNIHYISQPPTWRLQHRIMHSGPFGVRTALNGSIRPTARVSARVSGRRNFSLFSFVFSCCSRLPRCHSPTSTDFPSFSHVHPTRKHARRAHRRSSRVGRRDQHRGRPAHQANHQGGSRTHAHRPSRCHRSASSHSSSSSSSSSSSGSGSSARSHGVVQMSVAARSSQPAGRESRQPPQPQPPAFFSGASRLFVD